MIRKKKKKTHTQVETADLPNDVDYPPHRLNTLFIFYFLFPWKGRNEIEAKGESQRPWF
jgi:hypothetical protein